MCQCPLGLILHFYLKNPKNKRYGVILCQCPLGLILHFYWYHANPEINMMGVNALSGLYFISTSSSESPTTYLPSCQCPLGLILHFYKGDVRYYSGTKIYVSMPSRAYTSFLRSICSAPISETG